MGHYFQISVIIVPRRTNRLWAWWSRKQNNEIDSFNLFIGDMFAPADLQSILRQRL